MEMNRHIYRIQPSGIVVCIHHIIHHCDNSQLEETIMYMAYSFDTNTLYNIIIIHAQQVFLVTIAAHRQNGCFEHLNNSQLVGIESNILRKHEFNMCSPQYTVQLWQLTAHAYPLPNYINNLKWGELVSNSCGIEFNTCH